MALPDFWWENWLRRSGMDPKERCSSCGRNGVLRRKRMVLPLKWNRRRQPGMTWTETESQ